MSTTDKRITHPRVEHWWVYPPIYAVAVYLTGFVPGLPWWAFVVIGGAAALFGALAARAVFDPTTYGPGFASFAGWGAALAGLGAAVWLATSVPAPTQHWQWLVVWLVVFSGWWALVVGIGPRVADAVDRSVMDDARAPLALPPAPFEPYPTIFARAQLDGIQVVNVEVSPSGGVETVTLKPVRTAGRRSMTFTALNAQLESIATEAAAVFEETRGIDVDEGDVIAERGRNNSEYKLHFTVKRVLQGAVPFVMDVEPQPWATAWVVGKFEDDRPIELQLCHPDRGARDLDIVGMKGSGKSVTLDVLIARLTSSDEGEVWLIGTKKLVKLAWSWVLPWLRGETDRPVIDRIAGEDEAEAVAALVDALHYAELCNRLVPTSAARKPTRGKGGLCLVMDEVSKLLSSTRKYLTHDGRMLTPSQIVNEIQALARTAPVSVVKANQDQLFGSFGSAGPEMQRHSGMAIALQVRRRDDADKLMTGLPVAVNATKLRDNQMYVRLDVSDERVMRGKAQSLLEHEVPRVAAHNTRWRYGLDPEITRHLRTYADRWAPAHHAALIEAARQQGLEWPVSTRDDHPGEHPAPAEPPTQPAPAGGDRPAPTRSDRAPAPAAPAAPASPAPASPAGDLELPPGWAGEDFDIWAALGEGADTSADQGAHPTHSAGGNLPAPDTTGIESAARRLMEQMRAHRESAVRPPIPDPLGIVLALLAKPGAPTEWVPTWRLAVALEYVPAGAEKVERDRAVARLGMELWRQAGIKSEQLPKAVDERRPNGYRVEKLREAGRRLGDGP